jgi:hypothetical protein
LIEKENEITNLTKLNSKLKKKEEDPLYYEMNDLLQLARIQANRDQELNQYKERFKQLEKREKDDLNEKENIKDLEDQLKLEIEKVQNTSKMDSSNLIYLKNVLLKFLTTNVLEEKKYSFNVIKTILMFNKDENIFIEKFIKENVSKSWYSFW